MESEYIKKVLQEVRDGKVDVDTALEELRELPFEDLGFCQGRSPSKSSERLSGGDLQPGKDTGTGHPDRRNHAQEKTIISWRPGLPERYMKR